MPEKGIVTRFKNKIKFIRARKDVEKGKNHVEGWDLKTAHSYWSKQANVDEDNNPSSYANFSGNKIRADYIYQLISGLKLNRDEPILELGTNSGFVLSYIYEKGYTALSGIEINSEAVNLFKNAFPKAFAESKIINNNLENVLPNMQDNTFSLVYSMGVLMHVHPSSNFIFKHIARISSKYIITMEGETMVTPRHYPRDYKKIFEGLGFKEIFFEMTAEKIPGYANLHCRVFQKIS